MSHTHGWPRESVVCIDISDDVCLFPTRATDPGARGYWMGHDVPDGGARCMGRVPTGPDHWTERGSLLGGDLTLEPSIVCAPNGRHDREFHGWVRDGGWVPA